jgi:UDP-N-acetylglucosamine 2-epimerase (non-hydrolysing)
MRSAWPEVVESGNCQLIGDSPNQIAKLALDILRNPDAYRGMRRPAFPYGSGKAADRILDVVTKYLRTAPDHSPAVETNLALAR